MDTPVRKSVKALLIDKANQLLLIHIDDPKITNVEGKYHGSFWTLVGGGIETNESLEEAAIREIYEETGMRFTQSDLGPVVWYGSLDLLWNRQRVRIEQTYLVVKTKTNNVHLKNLVQTEKEVVQELRWFSVKDLQSCKEVIYPVTLIDHIEDILLGKYPIRPLKIDLSKQPDEI